MRANRLRALACLLLALGLSPSHGITQNGGQALGQPGAKNPTQLEQRVDQLSVEISAAKQRLADSQAQILQLQTELQDLRAQLTHAPVPAVAAGAVSPPEVKSSATVSVATIEERQEALEEAVKVHDQTKVESGSKYPLRLTGLILFNGFLNQGLSDNNDLPEVALHQTATSGNGSAGGSLRQTILGIEANGPRIAGAHTSASIDFDFFAGVAYSNYGTSAGIVRMRTASINFNWAHDSLSVGMSAPLISPLSPSSYATVAEPALAGAGNLWTWAPQLRYAHSLDLRNGSRLQTEFGLWDSAAAGYTSTQLFRTPTPAELAKQPAYEMRLSYIRPGDQGLQVGVSGYYSRQAYPGYEGYHGIENLDSWAGTFDFRVPLKDRFELSGEGYRGRALGGLGGGAYKDVIAGIAPGTDIGELHGLNAIGGWTQFKTRFGSSLEANMSIGLDDGLARDFHAVLPSPYASETQLRARNRMVIGNVIFRPRTYIILSPEYRRIWTWPINGPANTVGVFTFTAGYQF